MTQPTDASRLAELIASDFYENRLDLSARRDAASSPWSQLPEVETTRRLKQSGASDRTVRLFLTFIAAMDRVRDAARLWNAGLALYDSHPELFDPAVTAAIPIHQLRDVLSSFRVSQRHGPDTRAWSRIASSLGSSNSPVSAAVEQGVGDAQDLLVDLKTVDQAGSSRYPILRGPKVGPMWVRMLANPGGAKIDRMDTIPVAVDVHVRRVTENLGVADTRGRSIRAAKPVIQSAWRRAVAKARIGGPPGIQGSCAALDPALWFFGIHGCSYCELVRRRIPIGRACGHCQLGFPQG